MMHSRATLAKRRRLATKALKQLALGFGSLLIVAGGTRANEVAYFSPRDVTDSIKETSVAIQHEGGMEPVCLPEVQDPSKVAILSTYSGGLKATGFAGSRSPSLVEVKISVTSAPVYLVLAGYHPVVWRLILEPGARLSGVSLIGYELQHVLDLPKDVPVGSRAFNRRGYRQQLECVITVELDPIQLRDWSSSSWSVIDSTIQAKRLMRILDAHGPLELHDHQYVGNSEGRLVFEVKE